MATIAHGRPVAAPGTAPVATARTETVAATATRYLFAGIRLALGWTFLWAFLDKLFGLGHETASKAAWINGGHPTQGFLKFSAQGPFADFYRSIAGDAWADWLFMIGLAGLAIALIGGVGMRIAAVAGAILLVLMWSVVLPPENNVFMDDHLILAGVLVALALVSAGDTLGFGRYWARTSLVRKLPWLK
jgi:thiosulfate dehydrogenase [quinone] large subunit